MVTERLRTQGCLADAKLGAAGLILTQGGEPTFVPHDTTAPEWNFAALGPGKLLYARRLARQLVPALFPGGVILQSFGKQYPGEPLPRWHLGIYHSRSGSVLWQDLNRLKLDQASSPSPGPELAKRFVKRLAKSLGLADTTLAAYEDFESRLRATGSEEALRLLPRFSRRKRVFSSRALPQASRKAWEHIFEPAGWVLPLDHQGAKWVTAKWKLPPSEDLTLIPGDSPIGLRLPLHRLPEDGLRRNLTVEVKDQELVVFLPPVASFTAFVELVQTIEKLATELNLPPIRLEGYPPPNDPDLESIALTSDPGVIEVNLPPVDNWPDFERIILGLYSCAEAVDLRGFKYQRSGRKVSTGGGAHILFGGPSLDRNPFVKRPTLLSSFLRFLQHHPSLSYVFSGLFTGPSCQAPRIDESAFDLPYELEITLQALEQMPSPGDREKMDAMLRNLLMDWNGNTHRAELSVDKFHNAFLPGGCKGLIEFRAFEMVPESEMLLAPNALLRALAACFTDKPFTQPLIDWREALHDKFALPFFLRRDFRKVLTYVSGHGFTFKASDFDPQFDFRFPIIHQFDAGNAKWTLRRAIEPWPVMGEHQGTGRVVDGTTDRLELLVEGQAANAPLIAVVNGLKLPLVPTGRGKAVGAVRYRLFDNPWGLQPQVKSHCPLRFEIVDTNSKRIISSFKYLNWKQTPGGYDTPPVSEDDAQERVAQRIVIEDALVGGQSRIAEIPISPRAPFTLDLRRC